jgi:hypothetical protein
LKAWTASGFQSAIKNQQLAASNLSLKFVDKKLSNWKTRKIVDAGLKPDFQKGRYRRGLKPRPFKTLPRPFKASPLNQRTLDS